MVVCRKCRGNYDPGEIIGGICIDCLEEEKQEQLRQSRAAKIISSPFYQMELNLEVVSNG